MVAQFCLDQSAQDLGKEERKDVNDAVHDLLSQSKQVVEVDSPILLCQSVAYLRKEVLG